MSPPLRRTTKERPEVGEGRVTILVRDLRTGLDRHLPAWRSDIEALGQVARIRARASGWRPTDGDAVRALLLSYVSAMTDWKRIQGQLDAIGKVFVDWSPAAISESSDEDLRRVHQWFLDHRLGTVLLRRQLLWLRGSASVFIKMRRKAETVSEFLSAHPQIDRPALLGAAQSEWKLPGVGTALACEFLKNMGFDDFKPDRHTVRIFGPDRLALTSSADPSEIRRLGLNIAHEAGILAAELDQMLWLYAARGYGAICGARPHCLQCPLQKGCAYPERASSSTARLAARGGSRCAKT